MAERRRSGLVNTMLQEVERRAGVAVVDQEYLRLSEQAFTDLRATWRELDLLGYSVLDYFSGNPTELRPESRRAMARKSLVAWMQDPQAYRAVELMIDFAFGRGVPQPRAKSPAVQRVLDDFWNDSANKVLVSTAEGQRRMARDLIIQSNLFPLIFDDGDDGKVKVGLLVHDSVENVVRDENNRLLILYYTARDKKAKWNYKTDRYDTSTVDLASQKVTYYEHWANVQALKDEEVEFDQPEAGKLGDGKVYHLVENATTEMAFGVPMMQRTLRWFAAYNDFQAARVDMMKAAAAFIMKRKVKGSPNQLAKMATRAISRNSPLGAGLGGVDFGGYPMAGRAGSILNENDMVDHESMKIDSGAANAVQDADMLHGQIAAGTGLPKHYLGSSDANLATATAMELFVIKRVEAFQEIFESFFRALFDLVIQRAVDSGKLAQYEAEEQAKEGGKPKEDEIFADSYDRFMADVQQEGLLDEDGVKLARQIWLRLREDYDDQTDDEEYGDRDLDYEFSMPNPLRRLMADLITAIQAVATTFDPNNTNNELTRTLLAIAFGEGFEVDDPAGLVERIFPPGYVDPMIAMAAAAQGAGPPADGQQPPPRNAGQNGSNGGSGAADVPAGSGSRYGAPMQSTNAENAGGVTEALTLRDRLGREIRTVPLRLREATAESDERLYTTVRGHARTLDEMFDLEVGAVAADELERVATGSQNGKQDGGDD